VRVAGDVTTLLATHHLLTAPRIDPSALPAGTEVISAHSTDRQTTMLVRADAALDDSAWAVSPVGLEDLVLAYMSMSAPALEVHP
jgi:ABC-2 type transport system ATP-binding protein